MRVAARADDYNIERPQRSLGYQTPVVHAAGLILAASRPVDSVAEDGDDNRRSWSRLDESWGSGHNRHLAELWIAWRVSHSVGQPHIGHLATEERPKATRFQVALTRPPYPLFG